MERRSTGPSRNLRIFFIADFFLKDGVSGGAEVCNDELINLFRKDGIEVTIANSQNITPSHIADHKDSFFIVANFMMLSAECKHALRDEAYLIYEHDHKYVSTNDPSKFRNMLAPSRFIINKDFYEAARAVFCQSKIHAKTLQKNLLIDHVVNLGGNLWSDEKMAYLESLIDTPKTRPNGVMSSQNKNKGMPATIKYCKDNNIDFELIPPLAYEDFLVELAKTERLVFFPQWLETFNRVSVEAKILGCRLLTNKLIGAASEDWFRNLQGREIISFLKVKREEIYQNFIDAMTSGRPTFIEPLQPPKISIITSMYKSKKYIMHFMKEVTNQTIFDECEFIILDANSPDGEYEDVLAAYIDKYPNIIYKRLDTTPTVQETMNMGLEMATGEYITLWNVDDTRRYDALEVLAKNLLVDSTVDLVYADSYQTGGINETYENNSSSAALYEHSSYEYSPSAMVKCLPGPLPMWRKTMTDTNGLFDESLKYAGDWDMWLRCVRSGSKFKKVNEVLGLYYYNPEGLSTRAEGANARFNEERSIFFKYKNVFGQAQFSKFKEYFKNER